MVQIFFEQSEASKFKLGNPSAPGTRVGALCGQVHYDKVKSYFEYAKSLGKIVFGYGLTDIPEECEQGLFLPPTIITDIPQDDKLNRYEKLTS